MLILGFPGGLDVKESACTQETWVRSLGQEDPLKKEWLHTPVFLPGDSQGQRSLAGSMGSWGHKESDMTEQQTFSLLFRCYLPVLFKGPIFF